MKNIFIEKSKEGTLKELENVDYFFNSKGEKIFDSTVPEDKYDEVEVAVCRGCHDNVFTVTKKSEDEIIFSCKTCGLSQTQEEVLKMSYTEACIVLENLFVEFLQEKMKQYQNSLKKPKTKKSNNK